MLYLVDTVYKEKTEERDNQTYLIIIPIEIMEVKITLSLLKACLPFYGNGFQPDYAYKSNNQNFYTHSRKTR